MSSASKKPNWQLPAGVSRGTWDYIRSDHIATEYDDYFADSALMRLDIEVVRSYLPPLAAGPPPQIADLGCGTARVARALLPLGFRLQCVDLSHAMLRAAAAGIAQADRDRCTFHCANLVELDSVLDASSIDMAVCLFSSLGMIRGQNNRRRFLSTVNRTLKPDGKLLLHVHNRYRSLFDPGGTRWLLQSWLKSCVDRKWELGDRVYAYRRLPAMFLHIYSRRELLRDLRASGFERIELLPIAPAGDALLDRHTPFTNFRAGGFFALGVRSERY